MDPCGFGIVIVAFPFLEALERVALFLGWLDGKKHVVDPKNFQLGMVVYNPFLVTLGTVYCWA